MPYSYVRPRTYALNVSPMPDLADYITTEEAAKALGLHIVTVRLFLRYKRLEGIKVGRTWLVSKKALEEYKAMNEGKSKHDPTRQSN